MVRIQYESPNIDVVLMVKHLTVVQMVVGSNPDIYTKLRHRIAAIAADCKSAVFRLRWFESNCLNKCSIRLTVRTQDFHSCNRGSIPRYCTKFLHGVYSSVGRVPDCGSGGRRFESVCIPYKVASLAQLARALDL